MITALDVDLMCIGSPGRTGDTGATGPSGEDGDYDKADDTSGTYTANSVLLKAART